MSTVEEIQWSYTKQGLSTVVSVTHMHAASQGALMELRF